MTDSLPARGEIWLVDLDPTQGREQRGRRPAVVVSADVFNHGPAELVILCPVTKVSKGIVSHVPIDRAVSGLDHDSWVICEQVRCVSRGRLERRIGRVAPAEMQRIGRLLTVLLDL